MQKKFRDRYRRVTAALLKAKAQIASGQTGIAGLHQYTQAQKDAGKLMFDLVLNEDGTDEDLQMLMSHAALFEVILASLDHRSAIMSRVNQEKSRGIARKSQQDAEQKLFAWLDREIKNYKGRLEQCAADAVTNVIGLGRGMDWVRKQITKYRKQKK